MSDPRIPQLAARLAVTGEIASAPQGIEPELYEGAIVDAVKRFQRRHGLEPDGVIGTQTLVALNIPVEQRLRQIVLAMERWRWMPEELGAHYVLVNIAGFQLRRIEQGKLKEKMRVIVGKPYRRTPVFSDTMKYVEINPFWTVPYSIATRDKLPVLKKNPASLAGAGFEAFNGSQKISLTGVDWSRYSGRNFPFTLRQKPGPKNALGRVKFMFPNRFNVYLHDTPQRGLFEKTTRAFSSGCIRLHRPIDLADQLLSQESGWSRPRIESVLTSGKRTVVSLTKPIAVHLTYSTAWRGEDGSIQFRNDIYRRDLRLYKALFAQQIPW